MPRSKAKNETRRAPRVKLAGTVLALVKLENGRQIRARLHQLSFTGGLLHLDKPVDEGIKAEVIFHVGGSTIRSKAAMLFPMWATQGCLQPFEFTGLGEKDRAKLDADLQALLNSRTAVAHYEIQPQDQPEGQADDQADDQASEAAAGSTE